MYKEVRNQIVAFLIGAAVLIVLVVWLIHYEKHREVIVEDRWWTASTYVKYDVSSTHVSVDFEGNVTVEEDTTTYTRCSDALQGRELPVVWPGVPCELRSRDYVKHSSTFTVRYRVEERGEVKTVDTSQDRWVALTPGTHASLVLNVFGHIREMQINSQ